MSEILNDIYSISRFVLHHPLLLLLRFTARPGAEDGRPQGHEIKGKHVVQRCVKMVMSLIGSTCEIHGHELVSTLQRSFLSVFIARVL